ncbi:hypothetical protein ASF78_17215 [Cellulomonas sp. Leaf334]|nr:hypothetical protein ASF78_17215 [Cellulomonas sp. Leaf334]
MIENDRGGEIGGAGDHSSDSPVVRKSAHCQPSGILVQDHDSSRSTFVVIESEFLREVGIEEFDVAGVAIDVNAGLLDVVYVVT